MERLTVKRNGVWHFEDLERGIDCTGKAIDRLSAYEDTELEPDMVVKTAELAFFVHENGLDRLRDLLAAEKDGRCVVLPCKVGDTVYKLGYKPCHNGEDHPDEMSCCGCEDECDIERAVIPFTANSVNHIVSMMDSLGRFWFLTHESAEAALKAGEPR